MQRSALDETVVVQAPQLSGNSPDEGPGQQSVLVETRQLRKDIGPSSGCATQSIRRSSLDPQGIMQIEHQRDCLEGGITPPTTRVDHPPDIRGAADTVS